MAWTDLAQGLRTACIETWGIQATLQPQGGDLPVAISGVFETPSVFEDFLPGSISGVSVIRFWVDFDNIDPQPQRGDQITINGVTYDIGDVRARPEGSSDGGATLILRRSS